MDSPSFKTPRSSSATGMLCVVHMRAPKRHASNTNILLINMFLFVIIYFYYFRRVESTFLH